MEGNDNVRLISTVEHTEMMIRYETGETSRRNAIPIFISDESPRLSASNQDEWLVSIMIDGGEQRASGSQMPRIQRVPSKLREIESNKECFDPMVVAIGPYHHNKTELQLVNKLKITTARQFVSGNDKPIDIFYKKVVEVSRRARGCYAVGSTNEFNDEEFAKMMFLDGCFILHLIDCIVHKKRNNMKMKCHQIAFVLRDLFLLENQLPFLVLQELMNLRFPADEGRKMINDFIKQQIRAPDQFLNHDAAGGGGEQPLHLLELMRTKLLGKNTSAGESQQQSGDEHSFRSVKELKAVGINFKKSNTSSLKNVKFKSLLIFGELSLPQIAIDDSSRAKFLNLIAYETCLDTPDDYGITSYICFMDKLIDIPDDVKELRKEGILLNFLGSDEEVANLFNQIAKELVPDPHAYGEERSEIGKHYKNKKKIWMTEMWHDHFSSPWTAVAFLAAVYLIALSTVQTYFTIFPRK